MNKLLPVFAALAVSAPALAAEPFSFSRDGIDYVATDSIVNGLRVIEGREVRTGRPFHLVVAKGQVTGIYDGQSINYAVPRAKAAAPELVAVR